MVRQHPEDMVGHVIARIIMHFLFRQHLIDRRTVQVAGLQVGRRNRAIVVPGEL